MEFRFGKEYSVRVGSFYRLDGCCGASGYDVLPDGFIKGLSEAVKVVGGGGLAKLTVLEEVCTVVFDPSGGDFGYFYCFSTGVIF